MAEQHSQQEKKFSIPDTPLEVKLSLQRDRPPVLQVAVGGPKRNEHKDPHYINAINQLFDELKDYIAASNWFPAQGRAAMDKYAADDTSLQIRYPGDPPPRYPISLVDMFIRDPIAKAGRAGRNKKNADKLFAALSERMPAFIADLSSILESDRLSAGRGSHGPHSREIKVDKERKAACDLLGVRPDESWEKVKSMYRDKARKAHPDANKGVDDGSFHQLQNAYELLRKWHEKNSK